MIGLLFAAAVLQAGYPDYKALTDEQVIALNCEQATLDADRFFAECITAQSDVWRKRVDGEYVAALKRVDPEMRRHVVRAQAAWRAFEKAACAQWDDVKGSVAVRLTAVCYLDANRRRASDLKQLDGLSG